MAQASSLAPSAYSSLLKQRQANDPLAQTSPGQINQQVNKVVGMYGTPMPDAQIQSTAQGELDPIIAAITANINKQAGQATTNITGNANSLASNLGQIDFGAPTRQAMTDQTAFDAALQQSLSGAGNDQAQSLESRLAMIQDPTVGAAGSGLASRGSAIGTTQLANGQTNLGNLLAEAAAAKTYGLKLPGIARMQGLQDVAGVNQQATKSIGDASTQLLGQLPGIVQNLRSENNTLRGNRASAANDVYNTLTGQNITKATASAGLGLDYTKAAQTAAYENTRTQIDSAKLGIDQQNANTAAARAQVSAANSAARIAKQNHPTLTAGESANLAIKAAKDAEDLYHGITKPNSKDPTKPIVVQYTSTYQDAIKTLEERYPSLGKKGAAKLANAWYKPGQYGRPAAPYKSITTGPTLKQAGKG